MKSFVLVGLTSAGKQARSSKSVISYKEKTRALSAVVLTDKIQVTTHNASHNLVKHLHLNQWEGSAVVGNKTYKLRAKVSADEMTLKFWFW